MLKKLNNLVTAHQKAYSGGVDKFQIVIDCNSRCFYHEHTCAVPNHVWGIDDESDFAVDMSAISRLHSVSLPPYMLNLSGAAARGGRHTRVLELLGELQPLGLIGIELTEHGVHMGHAADLGSFIRKARAQGLYVVLDGVHHKHAYYQDAFSWKAGVTHVKIPARLPDFDQVSATFRNRGIKVVAKQVESDDQRALMADYFQGFLIELPMTTEEILVRFEQQSVA